MSCLWMDDWRCWATELSPWLDEHSDADVLRELHSEVEPDWLGWLDRWQADVDGNIQSSASLFEHELRLRYAGVGVVHATRSRAFHRAIR